VRILTAWILMAVLFQACLATAPLHPRARQLNAQAVVHLKAGKLEDARTHLMLSLEYNPCHADALHNLALIYLLQDDLEAAELREREALECNPELVQAVSGLGVIRKKRGFKQEALSLFELAVSMDPGYLDARRNLIATALELQENELAQRHNERLRVLEHQRCRARARERWREH
jgi:tetratricopeptide (TPR) repeat protein